MFCTKCGAEVSETMQFCAKCGTPVLHISEQSQSFVSEPTQSPFSEPGSLYPSAQQPYVPQQDTYLPEQEPVVEAPAHRPKKKKSVWPIVLICSLLALIAAAVCVVLFVPSVHDLVFGTEPEDLSFEEGRVELAVGDKYDLTDLLDAGTRSDSDVVWSTSDKDVATVKNGVVTAIGPGECSITVEDRENDDLSDELTVIVYAITLEFDDSAYDLEVDDELDLMRRHLTCENIDTDDLKWSTSDDSVADVDNGVVYAVGSGTAVITVKAGSLKATCKIIVAEEEEEEETKPDDFDDDKAMADIRSWYYSPGSGDVLRKVSSGSDGWDYGREYLFHNGELVFAYVFSEDEEYRLYYYEGELFHVIDTDRYEYTGSAVEEYRYISDQAESDALNYAP